MRSPSGSGSRYSDRLCINPRTVNRLAAQGIPILERYASLDELEGVNETVITAHGYPKELKEALTERGIAYHDATCPVLLKWVYRKIENFERDGYHVILIGNPNHAEIIASRSYGQNISVVYSAEDVDALPDGLGLTAAVCQTTITREKFQGLVDLIRERRYPDLKAVDTRCHPVKNQQEAVESLAQWVDAMVIVGGFDSSNTTNLARISRKYLPERTYHIDSKELLQREVACRSASSRHRRGNQHAERSDRRGEAAHRGAVGRAGRFPQGRFGRRGS